MATDRTPPGMMLAGAVLVSFLAVVVAGASAATGRSAVVGWVVVAWAALVVVLAAWVRWRPGTSAARSGAHSVRDGAVLLVACVLVVGAVALLAS